MSYESPRYTPMMEWTPERRARYSSKRRKMELELVYDLWNTIPSEVTDAAVHIKEAPKSIRKKHNKICKSHMLYWRSKDVEAFACMKYSGARDQKTTVELIKSILKSLPRVDRKMITDIPQDFRISEEKYAANIDYFTIRNTPSEILFQQLFCLSMYYYEEEDYDESLKCCNEALSLVPPLKKNEIPYYNEIMARYQRVLALSESDPAQNKYLLCLACIRLLDYNEMNMEEFDNTLYKNASCRMILCTSFVKKEESKRPYFTNKERVALMKEVGFNIWSIEGFKCNNCGKTEPYVKLSLCSGCANVWYCEVSEC